MDSFAVCSTTDVWFYYGDFSTWTCYEVKITNEDLALAPYLYYLFNVSICNFYVIEFVMNLYFLSSS